MIDISIYETGNGGDYQFKNGDLVLAFSILQITYLLLFGGNVEGVDDSQQLNNEFRNFWWGNFFVDGLNSKTEQQLNKMTLSSQGRVGLVRAIEEDLKPLNSLGYGYQSSVKLTSTRVEIYVEVSSVDESKKIFFEWDFLNKKIIEQFEI